MVAHSWGRNALFGGSQVKERARLLKAGKARLSLIFKEGKVQNKRHFQNFGPGGVLDVDSKWMLDGGQHGDLSDHWFRAPGATGAWLSSARRTDLFGHSFYERDKPLVIEIANWTVARGRGRDWHPGVPAQDNAPNNLPLLIPKPLITIP